MLRMPSRGNPAEGGRNRPAFLDAKVSGPSDPPPGFLVEAGLCARLLLHPAVGMDTPSGAGQHLDRGGSTGGSEP